MPEVVEFYKKYRPMRWNAVVGQKKLVASLVKDIKEDRVPTVYTFAGERGCGKTSLAKLVAKSINCLDPQPDGNPCNKCEVCHNIDNDTQIGVTYASMAHMGSVDDVRELTNRAYLHQPVKRQVYILDEVQNLSKQGWDALLIPLEDPSQPSLFILCTTEGNRIPKAIKSRSPIRNVSLVSGETMTPLLKAVCAKEGIEPTDELLNNAIRLGRGSVRDTLTQLQLISRSGMVGLSYGDRLFDAMAAHDLVECLKVLSEAANDSVDFRDFASQTFEDLGTLLLIAAGVTDTDLVGMFPSSDPKTVAKGFMGQKGITFAMNEFGEVLTRMANGSVDSKVLFEIALVKVVSRFAAIANKA